MRPIMIWFAEHCVNMAYLIQLWIHYEDSIDRKKLKCEREVLDMREQRLMSENKDFGMKMVIQSYRGCLRLLEKRATCYG